jgi:hypothetical protein
MRVAYPLVISTEPLVKLHQSGEQEHHIYPHDYNNLVA